MNSLLNDWEETSIGEVCHLINGKAFKPKEWSSNGLPIIRIQNLNNENAEFNYCDFKVEEKYYVNRGDLLFAWSGTPGTSFGAHIWKDGRAVLNQHIFKVNIDTKKLDKKFFMYLLNNNVDEYIRKAHGTAGLAHITKGKFEESKIRIPPVKEQKQIVDEIEKQFTRLDASIKSLEKIKKKLEIYRKSVLKGAFEKNKTATKKISELCDIVRGGSPRPAGHPNYYGGSIPFLKVADLTKDGRKFLTSFEYTIKEAGLKKTRMILPNTLLLTNSGATLGVPKISKIEATMNDGIAAFLNLDSRSVEYVYYFLLSKTEELRSINQGAAQPNLNTNIIKNIDIPYCDFKEQKQIVQKIESNFSIIDKLEQTVTSALLKTEQLQKSILKSAFEGKLVRSYEAR